MTHETIGEIPDILSMAIEALRRLSPDDPERVEWQKTVDKWAGENELRKNHIQAMLEPDRGDPEMRRTRPETSSTIGRNERIRSPRVDGLANH